MVSCWARNVHDAHINVKIGSEEFTVGTVLHAIFPPCGWKGAGMAAPKIKI